MFVSWMTTAAPRFFLEQVSLLLSACAAVSQQVNPADRIRPAQQLETALALL